MDLQVLVALGVLVYKHAEIIKWIYVKSAEH